jgi:predicted Rossmann-fold nucleotide-binding protein
MLIRDSQAIVLMPCGFGTVDEMFVTATLMQIGRRSTFRRC